MTAEEIKELRKKLNLSQPAFALKLGVSLQTVWRWEHGETEPSNLANEKLIKLLKKGG